MVVSAEPLLTPLLRLWPDLFLITANELIKT